MLISSIRIFTTPLNDAMFVITDTIEVSCKAKDQEEGEHAGHVTMIKTFYKGAKILTMSCIFD